MLGLYRLGPLALLFPFIWFPFSVGTSVSSLARGAPKRDECTLGKDGCECNVDAHCAYFEGECSAGTCTAHQCSQRIFPAGPSPKQSEGDCSVISCDGVSSQGKHEFDPDDVRKSSSECVVESCEPDGPRSKNAEDGTACGARRAGVCLQGECVVCKPKNPAICGGEGPNEPRNDSGSTPSAMPQHRSFCAYSNASDIDWYSFYADDSAWTYDALRFHTWSTAKTIELCVYAKCWNNRSPEGSGSCSPLLDGPNGSQGCCWTGAPNEVKPEWDLDCPGTGEDSGMIYVSVRTPNSSACEVYAVNGGY